MQDIDDCSVEISPSEDPMLLDFQVENFRIAADDMLYLDSDWTVAARAEGDLASEGV